MSRVAILVDLGFFLPRYRTLIEGDANPSHTAKQVAMTLFRTAERHVAREHGEQFYRIFVYDCKPLDKKAHHPITGKAIDFSRTPLFTFRNDIKFGIDIASLAYKKLVERIVLITGDSDFVPPPAGTARRLGRCAGPAVESHRTQPS